MGEAIAIGMLTLDALKDGAAATRALLPGAISPPPISPVEKPVPVAPAECPDEAAELLDDFLIALLDLPGDAWSDIAVAIPDELYDRIVRWFEDSRAAEDGSQYPRTAP